MIDLLLIYLQYPNLQLHYLCYYGWKPYCKGIFSVFLGRRFRVAIVVRVSYGPLRTGVSALCPCKGLLFLLSLVVHRRAGRVLLDGIDAIRQRLVG